MKKIYEVVAGAANSASRRSFYFHTFEDAEKMRDYIDRNKGASSWASEIYEASLFDSYEETLGE